MVLIDPKATRDRLFGEQATMCCSNPYQAGGTIRSAVLTPHLTARCSRRAGNPRQLREEKNEVIKHKVSTATAHAREYRERNG